MARLADLLKLPNVTLVAGSYLVANTRSESFVPSFKDTKQIVKGRQLYKIVGVGKPDGGTGAYASMNVVPLELNEEGTAYVEKDPIIMQTPGKIVYITGRNDNEYKDGYHDRHYVKLDVEAGKEHREILLAFLDFANTEFSLGVNDFQLEGSEYLK